MVLARAVFGRRTTSSRLASRPQIASCICGTSAVHAGRSHSRDVARSFAAGDRGCGRRAARSRSRAAQDHRHHAFRHERPRRAADRRAVRSRRSANRPHGSRRGRDAHRDRSGAGVPMALARSERARLSARRRRCVPASDALRDDRPPRDTRAGRRDHRGVHAPRVRDGAAARRVRGLRDLARAGHARDPRGVLAARRRKVGPRAPVHDRRGAGREPRAAHRRGRRRAARATALHPDARRERVRRSRRAADAATGRSAFGGRRRDRAASLAAVARDGAARRHARAAQGGARPRARGRRRDRRRSADRRRVRDVPRVPRSWAWSAAATTNGRSRSLRRARPASATRSAASVSSSRRPC